MSMKVAAAAVGAGCKKDVVVVVRKYDEKRDKVAVEAMEKKLYDNEQPSLITDHLGDPLCRVRHFSLHLMLVAECGDGEIVGVIRGCIKRVIRGGTSSDNYATVANILGLRVSPTHRRLGIGLRLVQEVEDWSRRNGADYSYMATDSTNKASIGLFLGKCGYLKFCSPSMLVHPVHAHRRPLTSKTAAIIQLTPKFAESIYRRIFSDSNLFPNDIDVILKNKLNLGTFIALPLPTRWDPEIDLLPPSCAILSIWNTKELFKFRMEGVSWFNKACCLWSRKMDSWLPWLRIPSIPDVFNKPFGVYFLYGLHMRGDKGPDLMSTLCAFAHNMGRDDDEGCGAIVTEVASLDPVKEAVPHWRRFSWSEDLWCVKKLNHDNNDADNCFTHSPSPSPILFVDPRDV